MVRIIFNQETRYSFKIFSRAVSFITDKTFFYFDSDFGAFNVINKVLKCLLWSKDSTFDMNSAL